MTADVALKINPQRKILTLRNTKIKNFSLVEKGALQEVVFRPL